MLIGGSVKGTLKRVENKIKNVIKGVGIRKSGYDDYYNIKIGGEFSYQRPTDSYLPLGVHDVAKIPLIPYSMRFLYDLMFFSTTLRTVVRALVWEIFRNGIEIVPRFACKCTVCGTEYNEVYKVCPNCGSDKLRLPNKKQYMKLKELMRRCNLNNDSLIDVLRDICYDGAVTDNMFLCVMKKYYYDDDGRLIGSEPIEVLRGSPMKIRLIMSKDGRMGFTDDGRVVCFCPAHRKECEIVSVEEFERGVRCKKCGRYMLPAWYETITGAGFNMFYAPGEILHAKMFTPGIGYGVSPILTVMIKVIVLMKMDWFVLTAYHLQRPPKGLLILRGNRESIAKAWQWLMEQARLNPHMIYPLIVEGTEQVASKRVAEWIDLSVKAQDIAFTEYRDEIRKAIGACFGVMPLFVGDLKGIGGLNSEGMQVLVTNRTVEAWQRLYNDKFFPWLIEQLGITDYMLRLRPNEVRDEMTELELNTRKIQLAQMVSALGYDVKIESRDGKIEIKFGEKDAMSKLKDLIREVAKEKGVNPMLLMRAIDDVLNGSEEKDIKDEEGRSNVGGELVGTVGDLITQMNVEESKRDWYNEKKDAERFSGEPDRNKVRSKEQRFGSEPQIPKR